MLDQELETPERVGKFPQPGELWSWIDLMRRLSLYDLVVAGQDQRYGRERYFDDDNEGNTLSDENKEHVKQALKAMSETCQMLGAVEVHEYLEHFTEELPATVDVYDAVTKAFWKALESKRAYFLDRDRNTYLENKHPFGEHVSFVFTNSAFDIEQASRALAFGLPTSVVFHLMRAMEAGVSAMAGKLGVTNTEIEWGKILGPMDDKIKAMDAGPAKKKWSELRADLWHVKECWRNETMHPRRSYTHEQAEEIFRAVKTFMGRMAMMMQPPKPTLKPSKIGE